MPKYRNFKRSASYIRLNIMVSLIIVSAAVSYLIGSFPTAYLLVKKFYRFDIRSAGSGNVGGRNSYETTGDKRIGIVVVIIDALKGATAYLAAVLCFGGSFAVITVSILAVVIGHNYSVWIGFRGGRGLATACGAMSPSFPVVVVLWGAMYMLASRITKDVIAANKAACVLSACLAWVLPQTWLYFGAHPTDGTIIGVRVFITAILGLLFVSHLRKAPAKTNAGE